MVIGTSRAGQVIILAVVLALVPASAWSQAPYPPQQPYPGQAPMAPVGPPLQQQPPAVQQEQPLEYAFRPDLSNPEYGECLRLEKNWRGLWQRYAQIYQQVRYMNPNDPQYRQMASYAQNMKQQLDSAWNDFSGKCIYFPSRRKGQP